MSQPLLVLGSTEIKKVLITHASSQIEIPVFYREPTTKERLAYSNSIVNRMGRKVVLDTATARLRGGLTVITGVGEGILGRDDGGKVKAVSTDPASADYYPKWKDLVRDHLGQELMLLGAMVFEGSVVHTAPEEDEGTGLEIVAFADADSAEILPEEGN
ncbi:MAG: hypothetical protein WC340_18070 [Kiritimatiellia bacterium]